MSDFEDIQRLIRLKRHELPPEDFVDDFVRSFQQRQRAELLKSSARSLLWERVATYFEGFSSQKLAWGAAAAAVVGLGIISLQPGANSHALAEGTQAAARPQQVASYDAAAGMPITDQEVAEYLLSRHYDGLFNGQPARAAQAIDTPQFAQPFSPQAGSLLPVGFSLDVDP